MVNKVAERLQQEVSNPWREAIEAIVLWVQSRLEDVSNPWREAIEARFNLEAERRRKRFQSLEGGY